jgi:hypothetical protein
MINESIPLLKQLGEAVKKGTVTGWVAAFMTKKYPETSEAEAPEAVTFCWKRLKICCFRFHSVSKLLFKFW